MNRIMVMGVSAGVGKSTFANQLGELIGIEVTHLDRLYWKPGWMEATAEEFFEAQQQIVQNDKWIIEGNYSSTFTLREMYADTVFYLELPLLVCLYRVLKRRVLYHGKTRKDMGEGCVEKVDWAFLKFILSTYGARKKQIKARIQCYVKEGKAVYYFTTTKQIKEFLKT